VNLVQRCHVFYNEQKHSESTNLCPGGHDAILTLTVPNPHVRWSGSTLQIRWRHEGFCCLGQRSTVPPYQLATSILSAVN